MGLPFQRRWYANERKVWQSHATVAPILADQAAKAYESGGPEALARFLQTNDEGRALQLFLLDGLYKDVLSGH
ncbi:hypothetical protein [Tunturiibacter gelidiferens]|uniref:hypothetical protein n=1 Tax=Tunturiibacter gelidiferens TaxID=3069689 RepID=UPI003D9BA51A